MSTTEKTTPIDSVKAASVAALPLASASSEAAVTAAKVVPKAPAKKVVKPVAAVPRSAVKVAAKPSAKRAANIAAKPAVKAPAGNATKPAPTPLVNVGRPVKNKKPKLVRDSFTIPKSEYTVLDDLKQRAGKLSSPIKKSELIRAGIKALAGMSDAAFLEALKSVPSIKTGRPRKG
jgi:hypothetical protein